METAFVINVMLSPMGFGGLFLKKKKSRTINAKFWAPALFSLLGANGRWKRYFLLSIISKV